MFTFEAVLQAHGIGTLDKAYLPDFGDGSDGVLNTTGNVTLAVPTEDVSTMIKKYQSITVNAGHTLTVDKRCRGLILYSQGDVIINGTIDMTGKSAVYVVSDQSITPIVISNLGKNPPVVVKPGGRGNSGGNGGAPTNYTPGYGGKGYPSGWLFGGAPGGGGGGGTAQGFNNIVCGGNGTMVYPWGGLPYMLGATGGAAGKSATVLATDTSASDAGSGLNGDSGSGGGGGGSDQNYGAAYSSRCGNAGEGGYTILGFGPGGGASGSSNNPATDGQKGDDGTAHGGGTVVIVAKGNIVIGSTGIIRCNGMNGAKGGNGATDTYTNAAGGGGGGGAGGGTICIVHKGSYTNSGTLQSNGGSGGPGGAGNYPGVNGSSGYLGPIQNIQLN